MNRILKGALKVFFKKICMSFVYFVMLFLVPLIENIKYGAAIYSAFICFLLYYWIYRDISAEGRKYVAKSQTPFMGVIMGAVAEIPTLLLFVVMLIWKSGFAGLNAAYLIYNLPFIGFLKPDGKIFTLSQVNILYLLPFLITVLLCAAAYFMGYKKIEFGGSITRKLIYKKDEEGK